MSRDEEVKPVSLLSQFIDANGNKAEKRLACEANKGKAFLVLQQNTQLTDSKLAAATLKYDAALKDYQANDIIDSEDTQLVVEPVVTHAVSSQKVILMPKTKPAPPRPKTPNTQPKYSLSQITQEEVETVTIPAAAIAMPQQNQVEPTAELPVCKDLLCKGNKLSLVEAAVIEKFAEQPKEIINTKLSIVEEPIVHQLELVKEDGLYALYDALCILDNDGNTALHRAVIAGSEQKVREILNPFAGIRNDLAARLIHEIKNKAGLSAAQLANEIDNFDILLVITTYL
jgi:hypothetical protein